MKSKNYAYVLNDLPEGCKKCLKGEKLVLFITGICPRKCNYCSLSEKRKDKDEIWANERPCSSTEDVIQEVIDSNATSASITGGDPLSRLERTLEYAKALKNKFGKSFHIHIYLTPILANEHSLKELSNYIDEVRFHPSFLTRNLKKEENEKEINIIKIASQIFGKQNTGIELPLLPDKKQEILEYTIKISPFISFVNLNEFEISDTNFDFVTENYVLNEDTCTIKGSKESGIWIIKELEKENSKLNINVCTAKTKLQYQFKNRLKLHKILPYGTRTNSGTVIYFTTPLSKENEQKIKSFKDYFIDKKKNRIIISPKIIQKIIKQTSLKLAKVEEYPTFDGDEVLIQPLN
ncbi:MAG: radical SAM protein [Candidatus Pacearchaeota archaeon]|nr:radical SAM protein [Candidatus Pacearchaeota archaeon]